LSFPRSGADAFYLPPDYLDNTDQRNVTGALTRIIRDLEQRELDVATGFFEPDAWRHVGQAFVLLDAFRLLLGKAPEMEGTGGEPIDLRDYYRRKLQGDLEVLPFDREYAGLVDSLLDFLHRDSVQVRLYRSFLHAKAYIFPKLAIVGSSNLTAAGLNRKAELNLVRKEEAVARALRDEWFENFWAEAEDYKDDLIQALEASKFGTAPWSKSKRRICNWCATRF
jgi:phosphatidylserine/phosphatidylglycerophosphate/cardiolipin synthase-like enzyme